MREKSRTSETTSTKKFHAAPPNAIALLTDDHHHIKDLFTACESLPDNRREQSRLAELVHELCMTLEIHAQIEEEIFYPAARRAIDDAELINEAEIEHASIKELVAQLASMKPGDSHYQARLTVLGNYVDHHVQEEEGKIFVAAQNSSLDLAELGAELQQRKSELQKKFNAQKNRRH